MSTRPNSNVIQTALENTPRELWTTSTHVSKALLSCGRLSGTIAKLIRRRAVDIKYHQDIQSEVALILQMKMFAKLDVPSAVYSVAFRVAELVIYNWGKRSANTYFSQEISISECGSGDEADQSLLDKFNLVSGFVNDGQDAERQLDQKLAKARLANKILTLGWPEDVTRDRKKIGRPSKSSSIDSSSKDYDGRAELSRSEGAQAWDSRLVSTLLENRPLAETGNRI